MTLRRAWIPTAALLTVVYLGTVAPDVTFWDAGEFIAAAHSLGIPHPPGTPLFILLLHTWGLPWSEGSYALAMNLFSALAMVGAAGISASLVARWLKDNSTTGSGIAVGFAAAVCAGSMSTAWSNATETEVYAVSVALAMVMMGVADRAGASADRRWSALLVYCFGLAAALHVSALVAAPAAILLASTRPDDGRLDWTALATLTFSATVAMALGTLSLKFGAAAALIGAAAVIIASRTGRALPPAMARLGSVAGLTLLGATPLLFMLVRARFDPGINQGNPESWSAFADVIGRHQYDLAPLWPRRAPLWLQLGNWFEYADWQSALSLGPTVIPTIPRTLLSLAFGALALFGSAAHRRVDRRSWRALTLLFVSGSLGVTLYLNLRVSPSFGWGILPADVLREARERDYFFVLGFWVAGLWAGIGALALARRWRLPVGIGVAVACLPILLNWSAVSRKTEPDALLPGLVARSLIANLPPRAVLFVVGDNDTYPVWYAQNVLALRPDVTVVTLPLLGADWYGAEIERRNPELRSASISGGLTVTSIANAARASGRPVIAAMGLERSTRSLLSGCWRVSGIALVDDVSGDNCLIDTATGSQQGTPVDTVETRQWVERWGSRIAGSTKPSLDGVAEYFATLLDCPRRALDSARKSGRGISLDSTCNP